MKKGLLTALFIIFAGVLAACGSSSSEGDKDSKVITVGATPTPHAEILEEAKPLLKEKGYELKIKNFTDYKLINKALATKDLDANYFQHVPYLEQEMKENKDYDLVNVGAVHLEPFGIYSKKYKSLKDLPDGAKIIMSNNAAEQGRMLAMLENAGLIKLKSGIEKVDATVKDIAENKKNLKIKNDVAPEMTAKAYEANEADAVFINVNYAIQNKLNPKTDSIELESPKDNPYANIIAVRKGDEDSDKVKALMDVLRSDDIKKFIDKKYEGSVISVSE
ncbi:methionine ABC transporter substrate-binding lipoprotein MetQ [Bacillus sp. GM2]|jgi:D-methionine transport system substrate-binding protein|uniref:methionine ABC transporter substrate-binding lipoprotein MetQ n=1 Tax=Bacillus TaxID=1386 RepID=UPI00034235DE|nr:methionine ABC transporter substrate-binding lipoprotein MetQ [Bacillus paralicheniformis]KJD55260.1 methionine ABC transporter substrate-binding protein [Bacillus amyloliquefaciens]KUL10018.1 methionine ABC transporter substrate-binding protein [Bacillus licheniformis LMG 7559]AGN37834.1 methionine ABC transporter substrate-binding protein MetQ [Bacillus paralicheniformis ATCC 9945a]ARA87127.1 methionine ABC transporter substrate-binding protein [Bacillus paralicheniformis]AYQ17902.1 ABC t